MCGYARNQNGVSGATPGKLADGKASPRESLVDVLSAAVAAAVMAPCGAPGMERFVFGLTRGKPLAPITEYTVSGQLQSTRAGHQQVECVGEGSEHHSRTPPRSDHCLCRGRQGWGQVSLREGKREAAAPGRRATCVGCRGGRGSTAAERVQRSCRGRGGAPHCKGRRAAGVTGAGNGNIGAGGGANHRPRGLGHERAHQLV